MWLRISPCDIMLVSVLYEYIHVSLLKQGYQQFKSMNDHYHIIPTMEYYTSMVDLLGHVVYLDEVKDFINNMLLKPKQMQLSNIKPN